MKKKIEVAVIMGSKSDEPKVKKCLDVLSSLSISYKTFIMSAHRTPNRVAKFSKESQTKGYKVIIAAAGLAAALPGVLASHTTIPVIGIPINTGALNGKDALYSIAQMPPGIPVACVGIDNAKNAAYLAASILSLSDIKVRKKLIVFRKTHGDV